MIVLTRPKTRLIRVDPLRPSRRASIVSVEEYERERRASRRRCQRPRLMSMLINPFLGTAGGGVSWPSPPALPVTSGVWAHFARGVGLYTDAGTTLATTDTDSLYQWNDNSGNGRHAVIHSAGSGGFFPALDITNSYLTIPSVRFNAGSGEFFDIPDMSALTEAEIYTVFEVDDDPAIDPNHTALDYFYTAALGTHVPYTDGVIYDGFGSTTRYTVGNPTPSMTTWRRYNRFSRSSAAGDPDGNTNLWQCFLDNVSLHTEAANTPGFPATPRLGCNHDVSTVMKGRIAECIIYDSKRTTTQRDDIDGYLISN